MPLPVRPAPAAVTFAIPSPAFAFEATASPSVTPTPRPTPKPTPRPTPRPTPPPSLDHYNALVTLVNDFNAVLKRDLTGSPIRWSTLWADADGFSVSLTLQPYETCYFTALFDLRQAADDLKFAGMVGDMPGGSLANKSLQSGVDSFVRGKRELSTEGFGCATGGG
jgi:hypothetical protein